MDANEGARKLILVELNLDLRIRMAIFTLKRVRSTQSGVIRLGEGICVKAENRLVLALQRM
jgi:hypothetical protein